MGRPKKKQKAHPGTTCFMTIPPNLSGYTETRCHCTAHRLAYSLGSSSSNGLRLLRIPPVPSENIVTVLPLLSFFCNGLCPTCPTNIAYKTPHPTSPIENPNQFFSSQQVPIDQKLPDHNWYKYGSLFDNENKENRANQCTS